jgi:hypothetical protein
MTGKEIETYTMWVEGKEAEGGAEQSVSETPHS